MKTKTISNSGLDIHFVSIDSENPGAITKKFPAENVAVINRKLDEQLGHLADEIRKKHGYINIYTYRDAMVGEPQFVDFSKEVWDKINFPPIPVPEMFVTRQDLIIDISKDDYLDHDNYQDV